MERRRRKQETQQGRLLVGMGHQSVLDVIGTHPAMEYGVVRPVLPMRQSNHLVLPIPVV